MAKKGPISSLMDDRPSLQEILDSWYDDSDKAPQPEPPKTMAEGMQRITAAGQALADEAEAAIPTMDDRIAAIEDHLVSEGEARLDEQENADVQQQIDWMIKDGIVPPTVDRDYVQNRLLAAYMSDDLFAEAWQNRNEAPGAMRTFLERQGEKITGEIQELVHREDRGLAAAIRGAREATVGPTTEFDIDYGRLSDSDFEVKKQEVFAAAKAGQLR